ncbi:hypothetical protein WJX74_001598 [Apatococcus lobatus]|uniref:Uncharacterized protein n=1 Tax=Apatococcus lobatus TaxID=904363 RepID=A0AAW1Q4D5_9CHLO
MLVRRVGGARDADDETWPWSGLRPQVSVCTRLCLPCAAVPCHPSLPAEKPLGWLGRKARIWCAVLLASVLASSKSMSPAGGGDRFRRNSPPFKRRREDQYYGNGRVDQRFPDEYGRRSPYQDRFEYGSQGYRDSYGNGRAPTPPARQRDGPPSFKEFMAQLPDEVTPDQAQIQYKAHMATYFGSAVKAEFEASKNDEWMRRKYHPRDQEQGLKDRNVASQEEAARFALEAESDSLDVTAQGKSARNEGDPESMEDEQEIPVAPEAAWKAERVLTDLKLTGQLQKKLDAEKGIGGFGPTAEEAKPATADATGAAPVTEDAAAAAPVPDAAPADVPAIVPAAEPEAMPNAVPDAEGAPAAEGTAPAAEAADAADAAAAGADPAAEPAADAAPEPMVVEKPADDAAPMEVAEPSEDAVPEDFDEQVKQLDINVLYLWRVHGVDYYAGLEVAEPSEWGVHLVQPRTLRGPRPEEGEEADPAQEKQELKQMDKCISSVWKKRMTVPDPYEVRLQKEKVEKKIDDFVEAQVKQLDENKWGNTLSKKLFKGKEYVLKHIRVKHAHVLEEQVNQIHEEMYWNNYRQDMEGQESQRQEMAAEQLKAQQQAAMQAAVPPSSAAGAANGEAAAEGEVEEGFGADGEAGRAGGRRRGGGANAMRGGNRARGSMMGMGRGGMMGGADGMMMGGMMMGGPMPGQMLVPAPGAGPFGPFIQVPIGGGAGHMGGGPDMMHPMMGGGRGRGRGRGRGGFGGPMRGAGAYYDLDAPENQRSVLDYGDL